MIRYSGFVIRHSNRFNLAQLKGRLKPFRLHWFSRLNSTNDHAAKMRRAGVLYAPAIVLTSRQLHGRGRGKNVWHAPAGALTVTFVLPVAEHLQPHQVPLIAGLAVRNAIQEMCGIESIELKWPNDLLHRGRKIGGLLCERLRGIDLIGVGINANVSPTRLPKSIRSKSTSLLQITRKPCDLNDLLATLAKHVYSRLSRRNETHFGQVLREYDRHHALTGRQIEVLVAANPNQGDKPLRGICVGLDSIGRLLLREEREGRRLHRIVAGHVVLR